MAAGVVLTVLIIVLAVFIVHKLLQEALDFMHIGVSVLGILIAILLVTVIADAISFRNNFESSSNIVVLTEGTNARAVFIIKGGIGNAAAVNVAETDNISKLLAAKDYKSIQGENYKLVLLKKGAITAAASEGLAANGRNYTSSEALAAIEALETKKADDAGHITAAAVSKLMGSPKLLIPEYQNGNIRIYPESNMFKVLRYVPVFAAGNAAKNIYEKASGFMGIGAKNES